MTDREQWTINETKIHKLISQHCRCAHCGNPLLRPGAQAQLAHLIPQRRWTLRKWGREIIHHPENTVLVCCLECNAAVQLDPESVDAAVLAARIGLDLEKSCADRRCKA